MKEGGEEVEAYERRAAFLPSFGGGSAVRVCLPSYSSPDFVSVLLVVRVGGSNPLRGVGEDVSLAWRRRFGALAARCPSPYEDRTHAREGGVARSVKGGYG